MRKSENQVMEMLVLIGQIGITMLVPILMCTVLGAFIGAHFKIAWISVVAFFIGAVAGFQNVYRLIKKYLKNKKRPGQIARENEQNHDKDIKKN